MKKAVQIFEELPTNYAQTNVAFSPDEQLILTGTSVEREGTSGGLLCFFDRKRLELISRVGISPTCSVVSCAWHPKLNQVKTRLFFILLLLLKSICNMLVKTCYFLI